MKRAAPWTIAGISLLLQAVPGSADPPEPAAAVGQAQTPLSPKERWARRCQLPDDGRFGYPRPQGHSLLGTRPVSPQQPGSSVLVSVDLGSLHREGTPLAGVTLQGARLMSSAPAAPPDASQPLVGTLALGMDSAGQSVEVAICAAEPDASDPDLMRYRLETWDAVKQQWADPCVATKRVPKPRALVIGGTWDARGTHVDLPDRVTFACESGVVAKCIGVMGYQPWQSKNDQSLADFHQACTRMMRADYCGMGRSHTREGSMIDVEDRAGVQTQTPPGMAGAGVEEARFTFEGAWDASGAVCLGRTRQGEAIDTILAECPDRFERVTREFRKGEQCVAWRKGARADAALVWNRSVVPGFTKATREKKLDTQTAVR